MLRLPQDLRRRCLHPQVSRARGRGVVSWLSRVVRFSCFSFSDVPRMRTIRCLSRHASSSPPLDVQSAIYLLHTRNQWINPESVIVCVVYEALQMSMGSLARTSTPEVDFLRRYFEADGSTRPVSISTAHILIGVVFFQIQSIGLKHSFALELTGSGPLRSQTFLQSGACFQQGCVLRAPVGSSRLFPEDVVGSFRSLVSAQSKWFGTTVKSHKPLVAVP